MDSSALKDLLRDVPCATDVSVPGGFIALRRRDIVNAGGDPGAVERLILPDGGRVLAAPEPIMSGQAQWRGSSRDAVAYVFRADLLD
jgi:hypothetical protein